MIRGDKILKGRWFLVNGKIYDPFNEKYLKGNILILPSVTFSRHGHATVLYPARRRTRQHHGQPQRPRLPQYGPRLLNEYKKARVPRWNTGFLVKLGVTP